MIQSYKSLVGLALGVVVATSAFAQAERPSTTELHQKLLPLYHAVKADAALLASDPAARGLGNDQAAMDAFLKRMPLSPMEFLQIDMEVRHYEVMVPKHIALAHERWVVLNEKIAREHYGDPYVDMVFSGWPADTGLEELGENAIAATVGTNKNVGSTGTPVATQYDGEIQIAVNHRNTNQMVAAANTWNTTIAACNLNQTQSVFYSSDGGATWGVTCAPSNNVMALGTCTGTVFGSDPALYWNDNNEVFLNYMLLCATTTTTRYSMVVARSADGGATWVKQGVIKNSWATTDLEDKNFYAIDNTPTSPFYGRHYTCWDRNNNEKFAYSSNNGATWTEVDLPTAPIGGVDLACEIAVQKNGTVHVVFDSLTCGVSTCSDERMWYTRSTNGGVSWSAPVQVRDFNLVGFSGANKPPVADNRGIGPFGAIDVDNSGGVCDGILYATFSDWTSGGATETDVWVSRSTNGGTTWGAPVKVNDDGLAARTQFHPFLQVDQSNGSVVVVWHDARNDANNRRVDYYTSRSTDCGLTFEANTKVSQNSTEFNNSGISYTSENTTDNPNRNPNQFGEYMGLDVKNGKAYMAWVDSRHFFPGSSTNAQKENVGFAVVDFGPVVVPVCGNNTREGAEICDGTDLGGQTCASQGFSGGGTLSCNATCAAFVTTSCIVGSTTTTFTSVAVEDGRIIESGETTNAGGTVNTNGATTSALRVGDTNQDRQQKGFVSFDTSAIPDLANVQTVTLRLRRGTLVGTNPFTTHGSMTADVSPAFGGTTALVAGDFSAAATATAVCTLSNAAANLDWSECTFNAAGLAAINKTGTTQVRVQFSLDDNDDLGNDYMGYYAGDDATAANRPQLVVTYQ
ncbi:MAG: sialidase family protein [Thermoanaerobaculia bacterium]|nr:sialidase family protein [Thermoanaerobaculia bacterium]